MLLTESVWRRWRACLVLAVLAAVIVPGAPGRADSKTLVDFQAWTATGPLAPTEDDQTIYVASAADQEQARAYVDLAVSTLPAEPLAGAVLVLQESTASVGAAQARLRVCALLTPLTANGRIEGAAPKIDCEDGEIAERSESGTWSVSLERFAPLLRSSKIAGVGLVPAADDLTPGTFRVAFDIARTHVEVPADLGPPQPRPMSEAGPQQESRTTTGDMDSGNEAASNDEGSFASSRDTAVADVPTRPDVTGVPLPALPTAADEASAPAARVASQPSAANIGAGLDRRPSKLPVILFVLVLAATATLLWMQGRVALPPLRDVRVPTKFVSPVATAIVLPVLLLLLSSETTTYKFGVAAIVFVAAIGLHILVNTAGEVSLAHAAFIGIPAFAAAQISARAGINPVMAVPLAVAAGALLGGLVALTALRARGLQVALATLAIAIATVQFLFFQEWLVGPYEGFTVPNPSLFGKELETSKSRTPVLVAIVVVACLAGGTILRSKLGRGMSLLRSNPDVAAAAGVPVALYRATAYVLAGAFAGLAGGAYVIWVQQVSPQAFPLQLGFTYLLIAALAGRGGLGGVAVAALAVQVGALFTFLPQTIALYIAPLALILQVTRFEGGINASLRDIRERINQRRRSKVMAGSRTRAVDDTTPPNQVTGVRLPVAVGVLMVVAGFGTIGLAWYNTGNTNQLWIQNQYIASGSLTGIGLIITGCALLLRDALLTGTSLVRGTVDLPVVEPVLEGAVPVQNGARKGETALLTHPSGQQVAAPTDRTGPRRTTAARSLERSAK